MPGVQSMGRFAPWTYIAAYLRKWLVFKSPSLREQMRRSGSCSRDGSRPLANFGAPDRYSPFHSLGSEREEFL
jgi:hypothetical protein